MEFANGDGTSRSVNPGVYYLEIGTFYRCYLGTNRISTAVTCVQKKEAEHLVNFRIATTL